MGYTHYWDTKSHKEENRLKAVALILELLKNSDIVIVNGSGEVGTKPTINHDIISFNGVDDDSHETFYIPFSKREWNFCKTARKPYDLIVCVSLLILDHFHILTFSSDGEIDGDDWKEAQKLFTKMKNRYN